MACHISHFDDVTFVRKIHFVSFMREQVSACGKLYIALCERFRPFCKYNCKSHVVRGIKKCSFWLVSFNGEILMKIWFPLIIVINIFL